MKKLFLNTFTFAVMAFFSSVGVQAMEAEEQVELPQEIRACTVTPKFYFEDGGIEGPVHLLVTITLGDGRRYGLHGRYDIMPSSIWLAATDEMRNRMLAIRVKKDLRNFYNADIPVDQKSLRRVELMDEVDPEVERIFAECSSPIAFMQHAGREADPWGRMVIMQDSEGTYRTYSYAKKQDGSFVCIEKQRYAELPSDERLQGNLSLRLFIAQMYHAMNNDPLWVEPEQDRLEPRIEQNPGAGEQPDVLVEPIAPIGYPGGANAADANDLRIREREAQEEEPLPPLEPLDREQEVLQPAVVDVQELEVPIDVPGEPNEFGGNDPHREDLQPLVGNGPNGNPALGQNQPANQTVDQEQFAPGQAGSQFAWNAGLGEFAWKAGIAAAVFGVVYWAYHKWFKKKKQDQPAVVSPVGPR